MTQQIVEQRYPGIDRTAFLQDCLQYTLDINISPPLSRLFFLYLFFSYFIFLLVVFFFVSFFDVLLFRPSSCLTLIFFFFIFFIFYSLIFIFHFAIYTIIVVKQNFILLPALSYYTIITTSLLNTYLI